MHAQKSPCKPTGTGPFTNGLGEIAQSDMGACIHMVAVTRLDIDTTSRARFRASDPVSDQLVLLVNQGCDSLLDIRLIMFHRHKARLSRPIHNSRSGFH